MEMTTTTGIQCPECDTDIQIETEGLMGGLFIQLFVHSVIERLKREGGNFVCGNCGHEWHYEGEVIR